MYLRLSFSLAKIAVTASASSLKWEDPQPYSDSAGMFILVMLVESFCSCQRNAKKWRFNERPWKSFVYFLSLKVLEMFLKMWELVFRQLLLITVIIIL